MTFKTRFRDIEFDEIPDGHCMSHSDGPLTQTQWNKLRGLAITVLMPSTHAFHCGKPAYNLPYTDAEGMAVCPHVVEI